MTELVVAHDRAELLELAPTGTLIAGGTDVLVRMRAGRDVPRLIDVTSLRDPPPIVIGLDGVVEFSALAPISKVVIALEGRLPAVEQSAVLFGSLQIRNRATVGGNLQNASPAADMGPPLVVAEEVPAADFSTGPGHTVLGVGEWISTVRAPLPDGEEGFRKLGGREAMAISVVSLAWRWRREDDGTLAGVRIAFGAVAPTMVRARGAEALLEGRRPTDRVVAEALKAVSSAIAPIDDVRGSGWYRREVAGRMLEEAIRVGPGAGSLRR
jgi:CO/xanthine dehydrogenase FAD-binding subunit